MTAELHHCSIPIGLLKRGFWIYVWKVETPPGDIVHYVGMTGDTSTYNPQSPFKRAADHLGFNDNSNPLRKYLSKWGHDLESCRALDLVAYGPLYEVPQDATAYGRVRGKVAALEKALSAALRAAKYEVVHPDPGCRFEYEPAKLSEMLAAFAKHFPELAWQ
jgi:hypothetical protein